MSVYLDASVIIPLFVNDAHSKRARALFGATSQILIISNFAAAEFASGLSRLVRMSELGADIARNTFAAFDAWTVQATQRIEIETSDIAAAESLLRRLDVPLTTPDALHISVAQRLRLEIATLDSRMAATATRLGLAVVSP